MQGGGLRVTGGEQDWDLQTWKRMIDMRAVDVVQPDVMYMGGIANIGAFPGEINDTKDPGGGNPDGGRPDMDGSVPSDVPTGVTDLGTVSKTHTYVITYLPADQLK